MGHHAIEYDEQCKSCHGTGIYVGRAERDGAGVVCYKCDGTGCHHVKTEYDDFHGRQVRRDVRWVYECNPGIGIGEDTKRNLKLAHFGGMHIGEWDAGNPFPPGSEMRPFTCPVWWYQTADYKRKPKWDECCGAHSFPNCPHFGTKELCWARWDREQSGVR